MKKLVLAVAVSSVVSSFVFAENFNLDANDKNNKVWTLEETEKNGYNAGNINNTAYINGRPVSAAILAAVVLKNTAESGDLEKYAVQLDGTRIDKQSVVQPGMVYQWYIEGTSGATMEKLVIKDTIEFHKVKDFFFVELDDNGNEVGSRRTLQFDGDSKYVYNSSAVVRPNVNYRIVIIAKYMTDKQIAEIEGYDLPPEQNPDA